LAHSISGHVTLETLLILLSGTALLMGQNAHVPEHTSPLSRYTVSGRIIVQESTNPNTEALADEILILFI
jgi:hypothetical protein